MAGELLSLIFGITAKADAALKPTFAGVTNDLNKLGVQAEKTNATMIQSSKGTQALGAGFQSLTGSLQGSMNQLAASTGPMGAAISGVSTALGGMTSAAGIAVGGIGALAGVFVLAAQKTRAYGDELGDLAEITGLSTDALGGMKLATAEAGVEMDVFVKGFLKFRDNAVKGSDDTKAAMKFLGLEIKDMSGDATEALAALLKAMQNTTVSAERNTALGLAWGKSYKDMIEVFQNAGGSLDDLIERARAFGLVLDKDAIRAAADFDKQMRQLKLQFDALLLKIGPTAIKTISTFINWIGAIGTSMSTIKKPTSDAESAIDGFLKRIGKQAFNDIKTFVGYIKWMDDQLAKIGIHGPLRPGQLPPSTPPAPPPPEPPAGGGGGGKGLGLGGGGAGKAAKAAKEDITAREFALAENERLQRAAAAQRDRELEEVKRSNLDREEAFRERLRIEREYLNQIVPLLEEEGKLTVAGFEPQQVLARLKAEADAREKIVKAREEATKRAVEHQDVLTKAEQEAYDSMIEAHTKYLEKLKEHVEKEKQELDKSKKQWEDWAQGAFNILQKFTEEIKPAFDELTEEDLIKMSVPDAGPWKEFLFDIKDSFGKSVEEMREKSAELGGVLGGVFNLGAQAMQGFYDGLEQIAIQFAVTGKTGPAALKKMTAAVLLELARQSAVYAVFYTALGFGELALGNFKAAGEAFLAAAIFAGIAVGAGALGRALGGGKEAEATGESGAGQFGGGKKEEESPGEVTIGRGDLIGQIGGVPAQLFERMIVALDANTAAADKIQSQPAGEVFVQGAQQRPDAVATASISQARTNAEFVNQFGRIIMGPA